MFRFCAHCEVVTIFGRDATFKYLMHSAFGMRTIRQILRTVKQEIRKTDLLKHPRRYRICRNDPAAQLLMTVLEDVVRDPGVSFELGDDTSPIRAGASEAVVNRFLVSVLENSQIQPRQIQPPRIFPFRRISCQELLRLAEHYGIDLECMDDLGLISRLDDFAPGTRNAAQKAVAKLEHCEKF